jgi:hypothetical protein
LVNDVINAGSAMQGTIEDLETCGATVAAIATLLTLGSAAEQYAMAKNIPLETIVTLPNSVWTPDECPLCTSGTPLQDIAGFSENPSVQDVMRGEEAHEKRRSFRDGHCVCRNLG